MTSPGRCISVRGSRSDDRFVPVFLILILTTRVPSVAQVYGRTGLQDKSRSWTTQINRTIGARKQVQVLNIDYSVIESTTGTRTSYYYY